MTTDGTTATSGQTTNGVVKTTGGGHLQTDVRLYGARASYQLPAALSILRDSPVIHVAFVHPGNGADREETVMNLPLLAIVIPDIDVEGEYDESDERYWAMYLHSHRQGGLVEAIESGIKSLTATTTKIDGMVFSPTPHDHSLDYRSATFHLHSPSILDEGLPAQFDEKRTALSEVVDAVTGYDRTRLVGPATGANVERTTVIKLKIKAVSCKQRYGAFNGGKEPVLDTPAGKEDDAFTGVVPCWTQWGAPIGYGRDRDELTAHFEKRSREGKAFADGVAWASDAASLEGLGKKRKPRVEDE